MLQYCTLVSLKSNASARQTFDRSGLRWFALVAGCMWRAGFEKNFWYRNMMKRFIFICSEIWHLPST